MGSVELSEGDSNLLETLLKQTEDEKKIKKQLSQTDALGPLSFLSHLTFSWINPLLRLGYSKPLVLKDIPPLKTEDEASLAYETFTNTWDHLKREAKAEDYVGNLVIKTLAIMYKRDMIYTGLYAFFRTIAVVTAPLLLYAFVQYISNAKTKDMYQGLLLVSWLVAVKCIESLSQRHWYFDSKRSGMRMRSALMAAVYQKLLKLSSHGRRRHSTGEIVNYMSVDAYRMGESFWWFHTAWSLVLQLFLSLGVLWAMLGLGALPGVVPLIIIALLVVPIARIINKCQSQFMIAQDERLRLVSEVLNNMRIIKLQSWEEKYKKMTNSLREREFRWLSAAQLNKSYSTFLYWLSPTIITTMVFIGCKVFKSAPLDAATIFTVLTMLRTMREPLSVIPEALSALIQVKVSLDRLNIFLLDDEVNDQNTTLQVQNSDIIISVHGGNFSWEGTSQIIAAKDIYLELRRGQKIAVCGPVGSGKSSLLHAILGELPIISGSVKVIGSIAYVSQAPWIQGGTIQDNILYGKPMELGRYNKVIKACALDKDIHGFQHGDLTEIGQRGLNLSGGQKQRIQIARAVYNDADIYLLDDPFSALDAHTAAVLFKDCVMTALENKTVVLVTHQVEFLAQVEKILVMQGGQVTQSGSYEELLSSGMAFERLLSAHNDAFTSSLVQKTGTDKLEECSSNLTEENIEKKTLMTCNLNSQLTNEEEILVGNVTWKLVWDYVRISKGTLLFILAEMAQVAFSALQAGASYWLAVAIRIPNISSVVLIGVYAGISTFSTVLVVLRSLFITYLGLRASKAFFSKLTNSVFNAPMVFFDTTPIGRIFTRVSSDMSILDYDIPFSAIYFFSTAIDLLTAIIVMGSVTWPVLIVAVPALLVAMYTQRYCLASTTELMRINGTTKAPIMNFTAETLAGAITIRAYNNMNRFFQNSLKLIDTDGKLFFLSNTASEWLLLRVESLQNLVLLTAALLIVLFPQGYLSSGLVGLSLSYALTLSNAQVQMTLWSGKLANYIVSVERIKQYMNVQPEPPAIIDDRRPPEFWPSHGRIELQELKVRYRPNAPLVLKGITCIIKEEKRVGVVGRTGSGKSTLVSALFRLVEPESGRILIDGLDICKMGLRDLRNELSIIPQEPTLFRGSIRSNLDPIGLYSDDDIWKALEKCQLKAAVSRLPNLLDSSVSDEGENWSVGQRQLFCLGRVLLKRNKILVLDEATASIDSTTDAIIQRIIRQEFSRCTVITVAHRVPTVVDSDMVMVLSYGEMVEYDKPSKLMETDSYFSRLVAEYWSSYNNNRTPNH